MKETMGAVRHGFEYGWQQQDAARRYQRQSSPKKEAAQARPQKKQAKKQITNNYTSSVFSVKRRTKNEPRLTA